MNADAFAAVLLVIAFVCGLLYGVEKIVKAKCWTATNKRQVRRSMAYFRTN